MLILRQIYRKINKKLRYSIRFVLKNIFSYILIAISFEDIFFNVVVINLVRKLFNLVYIHCGFTI